jgi:hypothetical protein
MADVSNRNLAASMRMIAWERAKGELRGILHTYWPSYYSDGREVDEGYGPVDEKVQQFIEDLDDLLL